MSQLSEQIATVKISVDFPDAEGVWIVSWPVYRDDRIVEVIDKCKDMIVDSLAKNAGELYATRVRYGKGLIQ